MSPTATSTSPLPRERSADGSAISRIASRITMAWRARETPRKGPNTAPKTARAMPARFRQAASTRGHQPVQLKMRANPQAPARARMRSLQGQDGPEGPRRGLMAQRATIHPQKAMVRTAPGRIPAMKSLPTEVSVQRP